MGQHPTSIARVRLERSLPRLLAVPVVACLAGVGATAAAISIGGLAGIILAVAGTTAIASAILLAAILLSLRLEVEVADIRVRWLGGERRYPLTRGPVTRIATRGPAAPSLRARFGALGWGIGPGLLRGSERIEVVRLSPQAPLILLPTARGRLAVAPVAERELLEALAAAARVQQRLEAAGAASDRLEPAATLEPRSSQPTRPAAERPSAPLPRLLTGIERARIVERLVAERERREAEAAALRERAAGLEAQPAADSVPGTALPLAPARRRERARWRPPAWLRMPDLRGSAAGERAALPGMAAAISRQRTAIRLPSLKGVTVMLLPSAVAGALWLAVHAWTTLPPAAELRHVVLALVLAGPAASAAAAVTWVVAPRLSGLLVIAGLTALLLVARALVP